MSDRAMSATSYAGAVALIAAWQAYEWAQSEAPLRCAGIADEKGTE